MRDGVVGQALDEVGGSPDPLHRLLSDAHLSSQPGDCDDIAGSEWGTDVDSGYVHGRPFLGETKLPWCLCL